MAQFLGFSTGADGIGPTSGADAPIDSSCSGTAGATSLSATNASFAADQMILIHQSRGTGVGAWELNYISSYVAGTITTKLPLANTYTDSGSSQAQVLVVKQYSGMTTTGTLTAKAWDGNVGGIMAIACSGKITVTGTLDISGGDGTDNITSDGGGGTGGGFRGGDANVSAAKGDSAYTGEGSAGPSIQPNTTAENGNGGGAGDQVTSSAGGAGGGGGSNKSAGGVGTKSFDGIPGLAGDIVGIADMTIAIFGGGGGGGVRDTPGQFGGGGAGGGLLFIFAKEFDCSSGTIILDGGKGGDSGNDNGAGGGAAAGGCLIVAEKAILGTNKITALGGAAGLAANSDGNGGPGGDGYIRVEACSITGTTNPAASKVAGGQSFCASILQII